MSCYWLSTSSDPSAAELTTGICVNTGSGGRQGQACTSTFDSMGNVTSDTCDGSNNFVCMGNNPMHPAGVCLRLCKTGGDTLCGPLGGFVCNPVPDLISPLIGTCGRPSQITDVGRDCGGAGDCQGGLCSHDLNSTCSAPCGGMTGCPPGTVCVTSPADGLLCAIECPNGNNSYCPGPTACQNINSPTQSAFFICT
jgi:hypothetical protein